jgi:DNA-binding CsgD family transcriptional regulator
MPEALQQTSPAFPLQAGEYWHPVKYGSCEDYPTEIYGTHGTLAHSVLTRIAFRGADIAIDPDQAPAEFSVRNMQVLVLGALGASQVETGAELHLSKYTVGCHRQTLFERLGVERFARAVDVACSSGILVVRQTSKPESRLGSEPYHHPLLEGVRQGMTNQQIGIRPDWPEGKKTVATRLQQAYGIPGIRNKPSLVFYGHTSGMLTASVATQS